MKTLTLTKAHQLGQLHDELLAAFPSLRDTLRAEGPSTGARVKDPDNAGQYVTLPADPPDTFHLTVPNDADEAAIAAVVKAHDPTVLSASERQDAERAAADTDLHAGAAATMTRLGAIISGGGAYTAAEVRAAVVDVARIQRQMVRYLVARLSG
ncbi:MAG TPA: hypothetical protein VNM48_19160 [Chloroflexota bacterium]|nr:hypothetical protein [Chloroflexota bacterium]